MPEEHWRRPANWTSIALAVLLVFGATAVFLSWPKPEPCPDTHRIARQSILQNTLANVDDAIIVLGDSIVEASRLPRSLCAHAVVNAGLGGASTGSDLATWLSGALAPKRAGLIVVSLGTNDALGLQTRQAFEARYGALLAQLAALTPHVVVMAPPPLEARGSVTIEMRDRSMDLITSYNAALPALANISGATFVPLPAMSDPHTIDGIHLNAAGYAVWDAAVLQGAAAICKQN